MITQCFNLTNMTTEVEEAIKELENAYGAENVQATADSDGGAYVMVSNLDIGEKYVPSVIWCRFRVTHMYPQAQVYPHFVNAELKRSDSAGFGTGFASPVVHNEIQTVQVSRSSKNWNPATDTAQIKLEKVLQWIKEQ
jgi:hypothetical protein